MELHPLCTFFPRMSDEEFNLLKDSLQTNGQTHPIYTLDGMILDGGNRYRALCELGIEPMIVEYQGPNPTQFILSSNLHRRHLTQGQSAAIVSASQSWLSSQPDALTLQNIALDTAAARAKQSGVGQKTQQLADKLVKEAPADLIQEVIDGKKSLNKAIKEITPPKPIVPKAPIEALEDSEPAEEIDDLEEIVSTPHYTHSTPLDFGNGGSGSNSHATSYSSNAEHSAPTHARLDALTDVKQLTEMNSVLNARIIQLTQEKDAAVQAAQHWKEKYHALKAKYAKEPT